MKRYVKADLPAFSVIPIVMLAVTVVTAVLLQGWALAATVLNQTAATIPNFPSSYTNTYINVGNNLNSFNIYLPLIFFALLLGTIMSMIFLPVNPLNWIVGVIFLPFIYYIGAWLSNVALLVFTQSAIAKGIGLLPYMQFIYANLQTIVFFFAVIYVIGLAIRVFFFNPAATSSSGGTGPSRPVRY